MKATFYIGLVFVSAISCVMLMLGFIVSSFANSIIYSSALRFTKMIPGFIPDQADIGQEAYESLMEWMLGNDKYPKLALETPFDWDPEKSYYIGEDGDYKDSVEGGRQLVRPSDYFKYKLPEWIRSQGILKSPFRPGESYGVTSGYGRRYDGYHPALDFSMRVGTQLRSFHSGAAVVVHRGFMPRGYGHYVVISDGRYAILLAHLSRVDVDVGQVVQPGQQVGLSGNTGYSTGPHLHLEVHEINRGPIDPCREGLFDPSVCRPR
jgi:murein DD-endopeptidase MepM/ murein hydrolase activator NlpD